MIFTEQLEEKALPRLNNSKCWAALPGGNRRRLTESVLKNLTVRERQPAQIRHCFADLENPMWEKKKFYSKVSTFLQEVIYQIKSYCGAFILHHRITKHKHIQPKSFKTELKMNTLFFMPGKAVERQLQRWIMVDKVFWLWKFDHGCKVVDDVSVKYSSVIKAWQFCFLLNSGHFWSEQETWTTQAAAWVDW